MTDLQILLERTADDWVVDRVDLDVVADIRRGRSALRRRRRSLVAGVAMAAIALGGVTTVVARPSVLAPQPSRAVDTPAVHAGAFDVPAPPEGWSVQAAGQSLVVIAPDDQPKVDLGDPNLNLPVLGKLVVEYLDDSRDPLREGSPIEYDGRSFYYLESAGTPRRVSVETAVHSWLVLQEAPDLHWTLQQMIEYLDGVRPSPDAIPKL